MTRQDIFDIALENLQALDSINCTAALQRLAKVRSSTQLLAPSLSTQLKHPAMPGPDLPC